ncbi:MAG TPA: DUF1788 domain-containing protein [Thermotogota bacterium]|nr:DUF1788 domain-containing protein [Thermotogota bacterium]HRW92398.1 DUF1788 domain-containing protein [Thermotogota bacterium]
MTRDMGPKTTKEKFDHLLSVLSSPRFLQKKGLGNEIPFFICPFHPRQTSAMEDLRCNLEHSLSKKGVNVLSINLFLLSIQLLDKRGLWEQILQKEAQIPKEQLKEMLQNVLDPEKYLVPAIVSQLQERDPDVLFLNGVGEVYPFLRSHALLTNLQSQASEKPVVLFFPGTYTFSPEAGSSLTLFGRLKGDQYYRAFNIFHWEP